MNALLNLFGIKLPIIQAPMAGATTPEMVIAVSEAVGLGSLPNWLPHFRPRPAHWARCEALQKLAAAMTSLLCGPDSPSLLERQRQRPR
jgi:NAD(P)H-dependent flavin oxidoreductase YrpB (nitropropane dioxygenase family)